jgi:hypothetical protein
MVGSGGNQVGRPKPHSFPASVSQSLHCTEKSLIPSSESPQTPLVNSQPRLSLPSSKPSQTPPPINRLCCTLPTSLRIVNPCPVGRTSSLHYYYLAFVVLTYVAYLIAVNTSYRSSLVLQTWAYEPLVALDWVMQRK